MSQPAECPECRAYVEEWGHAMSCSLGPTPPELKSGAENRPHREEAASPGAVGLGTALEAETRAQAEAREQAWRVHALESGERDLSLVSHAAQKFFAGWDAAAYREPVAP